MRYSFWRVALVLACVAVVTMAADPAAAARRSAFAGNQLIRDRDDVFAFPHLFQKYNHQFVIDYAPMYSSYDEYDYDYSGFNGSGSIIFGTDDWALNVNSGRIHNGDGLPFWSWRGYDQQLYTSGGFIFDFAPYQPTEWFDIGLGWGSVNPMGVSLGLASSSNTIDDADADGMKEEDNKMTMFDIQYSIDVGGVEVAASLTFGSLKDELVMPFAPDDTTSTLDVGLTQFAASARGYTSGPPTGYNDWGWLLNFAYASASDAEYYDGSKESPNVFALSGSFGPTFGTPGQWEAAAYLTIEYIKEKWFGWYDEMYGDGFGDISYFSLPSWNMAAEYYVTKWLAVRGGVASRYVMTKRTWKDAGEDTSGNPIDIDQKFRDFEFMWTAGLGIDKESWGLDLALNPYNLHTGYLPFGADNGEDDVLSLISMWLKWGKTN